MQLPGSREAGLCPSRPAKDPARPSICLAAAAAMHAAARASATSVSADCCIPAGLRLGPVPGTFKLGKYLSDRREPGPKKKVLAFPTSAPRRSPPCPLAQERGRWAKWRKGVTESLPVNPARWKGTPIIPLKSH